MKIVHLTASYYPAFVYGGPTMSITQLCENLAKAGDEVTVLTTTANGAEELAVEKNKVQIINGVKVIYFARISKDHTHFSPALLSYYWRNMHSFDIIHIHAWWNLVSIFTAVITKVKNKNFILSPRGTLSNYSFTNQNSFKKKIIHTLFTNPLLKEAKILCTSANERETINKLFPKAITHSLPNFVTRDPMNVHPLKENLSNKFKILFLSRVDKKKGIEFILDALALCSFPFEFTIAGDGEEAYIDNLKNKIKKLNIAENCIWLGHVNNTDKFKLMKQQHLLILPSYNENFANVIIESLSVGTAVMITKEVGLSDYVKENSFGWIIEQNAKDIAEKLSSLYKNPAELHQIATVAPPKINVDFDEILLTEKYKTYYTQNL